MKLTNATKTEIMYAIHKNKYKELKPNAFIYVPYECKNLQLKSENRVYILSIDEILSGAYGNIDNIVFSTKPKRSDCTSSLIVSENSESPLGSFLNFAYTDKAGFCNSIYAPKFDITSYVSDGVDIVKVNADKMHATLVKLSGESAASKWWLILILIVIVIAAIPLLIGILHMSTPD